MRHRVMVPWRRSMSQRFLFGGTLLLASLSTSCSVWEVEPPKLGTTKGIILVDSPEVYARERLVRDRERQKTWLMAELAIADTAFDAVQAAVASRRFELTSVTAGIDATPQAALAARKAEDDADALDRQNEVAALQHELDIAKLRKQIEAAEAGEEEGMNSAVLANTTPATGTTPAATTPAASTSTPPPAATTAEAPDSELTGDLGTKLPSLAIDALTGIKDSPIDRLRDKLAYRELVRQELLENDLDDGHDIEGNTLYRLTFDATVIPAHDSSDWAVVEAEIRSGSGCDESYLSQLEAMETAVEKSADLVETARKDLTESDESRPKQLAALTDAEAAADRAIASYQKLQSAPGAFTARELQIFLEKWLEDVSESLQRDVVALRDNYFEETPQPGMLALIYKSDPDRELLVSRQELEEKVAALEGDQRLKVRREIEAREKELLDSAGDKAARILAENYRNQIVRRGLGEILRFRKANDQSFINVTMAEPHLVNFCKLLKTLPTRVDPYAVTPKESVERIADAAATRTAEERALTAALQAGTVGLSTAVKALRIADVQRQMIRRQPLVVGYSSNPSKVASVGWLIGPRFKGRHGHAGYDFRQVAHQFPLAAVVSVPGWWPSATFDIRTCWLAENHADERSPATRVCVGAGAVATVPLPADPSHLTAVLFPRTRRPQPELASQPKLAIDDKARFVISGKNIWRNPVVLLGGQPATTVEILPDMKGLLVTIEKVLQPPGWQPSDQTGLEEIWVWTSEGSARAGFARLYKVPKEEKKTDPAIKPPFTVRSRTAEIPAFRNTGTVGLTVEFEKKEGGGTVVDKIFLGVASGAVPDIAATTSTPNNCLNLLSVPWEVSGPRCDIALGLRSLIPGRTIVIESHSLDKDQKKVPHTAVNVEIR